MIDGICVHALDEAEIIDDAGRVRHEAADPRSALSVLMKRFDRGEHELARGISGHRAEPFAAEIFFRHRRAVQLSQFWFVVEKIDVRWGSVLKEVNDTFCFGCKMRQAERVRRR